MVQFCIIFKLFYFLNLRINSCFLGQSCSMGSRQLGAGRHFMLFIWAPDNWEQVDILCFLFGLQTIGSWQLFHVFYLGSTIGNRYQYCVFYLGPRQLGAGSSGICVLIGLYNWEQVAVLCILFGPQTIGSRQLFHVFYLGPRQLGAGSSEIC